MAGKKKQAKNQTARAQGTLGNVTDYRHDEATRKNNPPAKIAAEGTVPIMPKIRYEYSPRLAPVLRFDSTGQTDKLPELLQKAQRQPLSPAEANQLAEALRNQEPWLEWANKREKRWFDVDPVALHIHERVSTEAILRVAARQDIEPSLFGDPQQAYHEAVQFYQHEIPWTNRLILGDSLQVMTSLSRREDLAGKVQMIYMDPPYGIKFGSNFQPEVGKRDVKDKDQDLTREPEMVKAYRDTWHLGVHSYLSYLRDRLIITKELLTDTGSIFLQISEENLHRVRNVLDEVFGSSNCVSVITFAKTSSSTSDFLSPSSDYLLWYARDIDRIKYRSLFLHKAAGEAGGEAYRRMLLPTGERLSTTVSTEQLRSATVYRVDNITSQSIGREKGEGAACWFPVTFEGVDDYRPSPRSRWKTNEEGMKRLLGAERVEAGDKSLGYVRHLDDFPVYALNNRWDDTSLSGADWY
jgi:adenine-specific DNA-methyltransferase